MCDMITNMKHILSKTLYVAGLIGLITSGLFSYLTLWDPTNLPVFTASLFVIFMRFFYSNSLIVTLGDSKEMWFYALFLVTVSFAIFYLLSEKFAKALDYLFMFFLVGSIFLKYQADSEK